LKIDLRFLGAGRWKLVSLADNQAKPDAYDRTERTVGATDSIDTSLRAQGGYVGWLRPAR
jgi:hypothetical protein